MSSNARYETVIGLEAHVQLATASKAFCGDRNDFGGAPNTRLSVVSLGYPGTLPRLNETQLEYAVRLGLALGCEINRESSFDRKNYFYADLPKGYQITQDRAPICLGGHLPLRLKDGSTKDVRIHHVHMEEDAGKSIHPEAAKGYSYVDLNRAGTPLLEIVTEPDLRSPEEVEAFMGTLRQLVRYLGISDGNMQEGSLRCDVNISVRPEGSEVYGTRCEVKNMNSMKFAAKAVAYEVKRQIALIESGGQVRQQTLQFDPVKGTTTPLRDKEDAHDYRYFPEPDLPPLRLDEDYIDKVRVNSNQLPWEVYAELTEVHNLPDYDAEILSQDYQQFVLFKSFLSVSPDKKGLSNIFINKILPYLTESNTLPSDFQLSPQQMAELQQLVLDGQVNASAASGKLLSHLLGQPNVDVKEAANQLGLIQNSDENFLAGLVDDVITANPDKVAAYRKGKKGLIGFFMGEVMRASKGSAEPKETQLLLRKALEE
ncbi:Asp-tRNA(Asn)/Glu-tRNA(Gln) amidotransferase GatCAB subunit B [Lewinellaceae bacterium SD302]|nr:Asp-tRNA(Asn)/Glu-tRNA(Gln) amidotransferase GatCAB subunit B [Lewinellaceae bacterium SD302]